jgi:hypothetical protein
MRGWELWLLSSETLNETAETPSHCSPEWSGNQLPVQHRMDACPSSVLTLCPFKRPRVKRLSNILTYFYKRYSTGVQQKIPLFQNLYKEWADWTIFESIFRNVQDFTTPPLHTTDVNSTARPWNAAETIDKTMLWLVSCDLWLSPLRPVNTQNCARKAPDYKSGTWSEEPPQNSWFEETRLRSFQPSRAPGTAERRMPENIKRTDYEVIRH